MVLLKEADPVHPMGDEKADEVACQRQPVEVFEVMYHELFLIHDLVDEEDGKGKEERLLDGPGDYTPVAGEIMPFGGRAPDEVGTPKSRS